VRWRAVLATGPDALPADRWCGSIRPHWRDSRPTMPRP
jgi:hypothetical protein